MKVSISPVIHRECILKFKMKNFFKMKICFSRKLKMLIFIKNENCSFSSTHELDIIF